MERQTKVIDASILIKWLANEDGSEKAIRLREKHINEELLLIIPELAFLEVVNGLRYKKLETKQLKKAIEDLSNVQLGVIQLNEEILDKAVDNSVKHNLSIYDAVYLSLAQINKTELITADKKLLQTKEAVSLKDLII